MADIGLRGIGKIVPYLLDHIHDNVLPGERSPVLEYFNNELQYLLLHNWAQELAPSGSHGRPKEC